MCLTSAGATRKVKTMPCLRIELLCALSGENDLSNIFDQHFVDLMKAVTQAVNVLFQSCCVHDIHVQVFASRTRSLLFGLRDEVPPILECISRPITVKALARTDSCKIETRDSGEKGRMRWRLYFVSNRHGHHVVLS